MDKTQNMPVKRRRALYALAATAAGLAGAGWAWWRHSPAQIDEGRALQIWDLEFDAPIGKRLALSGLRGRPLLVNFWATWCPPCVEELPLLNAFYRQNSTNGWQVLGVAVDQAAPVQAFLGRQPLDFPVVLAGLEGLNLSRQLGNEAGGLPFTVLFDAEGKVRQRKIGKLNAEDLDRWKKS